MRALAMAAAVFLTRCTVDQVQIITREETSRCRMGLDIAISGNLLTFDEHSSAI